MKKINLTINGKKIVAQEGKTILEVSKKAGFFVPSLCYHPDFCAKANCRVCVVELVGASKLVTACSTKIQEGMEIITDSERVKRSRNLNIEMIFAEHIEKCPECIWRVNCTLLDLADRYKVGIKRFVDRKKNRKIYKFSNAVEIDGSQCIDCGICVEVCSKMQKINYLKFKGKGANQEVVPTNDKQIDCIYCGQCAVHCPVGAAQEKSDWQTVDKLLNTKKIVSGSTNKMFGKIMVAQFAPSVRVSVGEEFGMKHGKIVTEQIVTGLKDLGFDNVFDVNFGADITTMVEAEELVDRIKNKKELPMFTSCCPAWVKYLEFYNPELIPNLTTSRSPHIHNGGIIKTYWAQKMGINPKDIVVVSVMPCTAKKFESARPEMKIQGNLPVDYVITTREFAWMMKRKRIDFAKLKKTQADNPLGQFSGAAAIYGSSGGVMESALRTAHHIVCGKKRKGTCKPRIDFHEVRGLEGVKEAQFDIGGKLLNVAVVNGIGNVGPILENYKKYHYIEVMACPGGCIGGGGQPYPTTDEIRKKRVEALYQIDKSSKLRKAHENKSVSQVLSWLKENHKLEHSVLHTSYKKRKR